jgi:hypothetical protein
VCIYNTPISDLSENFFRIFLKKTVKNQWFKIKRRAKARAPVGGKISGL